MRFATKSKRSASPRVRRVTRLIHWLYILFVLGLFIQNWRDRRAWTAYVADAAARGDRLDPQSVIPAPVPDAENFASAPLFRPLYDYVLDGAHEAQWRNPAAKEALDHLSISAKNGPLSQGSWRQGRFVDLGAWQQFYRERPDFPKSAQPGSAGDDVLQALGKFDRQYADLRAACTRPQTRFPNHYEENF